VDTPNFARPVCLDVPRPSLAACSGPLLPDPLGHITCYCNCATHSLRCADQREGHFNVEFATALVPGAGQGRTTLQTHDTGAHRGLEAVPMRRLQMLGDDEVE
jgi:hypothetical protein